VDPAGLHRVHPRHGADVRAGFGIDVDVLEDELAVLDPHRPDRDGEDGLAGVAPDGRLENVDDLDVYATVRLDPLEDGPGRLVRGEGRKGGQVETGDEPAVHAHEPVSIDVDDDLSAEDADPAVGLRHPHVGLAEGILLFEPVGEAVLGTAPDRVAVDLECVDGRDERVDVGPDAGAHRFAPLRLANDERNVASFGGLRRAREEKRRTRERDRQKKVPLVAHASPSSPGVFSSYFHGFHSAHTQPSCRPEPPAPPEGSTPAPDASDHCS
jgi:hypothetical protein